MEKLKYYLVFVKRTQNSIIKSVLLCCISDIFVFNSTFPTNLVSSVTYKFFILLISITRITWYKDRICNA